MEVSPRNEVGNVVQDLLANLFSKMNQDSLVESGHSIEEVEAEKKSETMSEADTNPVNHHEDVVDNDESRPRSSGNDQTEETESYTDEFTSDATVLSGRQPKEVFPNAAVRLELSNQNVDSLRKMSAAVTPGEHKIVTARPLVIKFFVSGPNGLYAEFNELGSTLVSDLIKSVRLTDGFDTVATSTSTVRLVHRGKTLLDNTTLDENDVCVDDTLVAVLQREREEVTAVPLPILYQATAPSVSTDSIEPPGRSPKDVIPNEAVHFEQSNQNISSSRKKSTAAVTSAEQKIVTTAQTVVEETLRRELQISRDENRKLLARVQEQSTERSKEETSKLESLHLISELFSQVQSNYNQISPRSQTERLVTSRRAMQSVTNLPRQQLLDIMCELMDRLVVADKENIQNKRQAATATEQIGELEETKRNLEELQVAHMQQSKLLQRMQKQQKKVDEYLSTIQLQEKVIGKMQSVMESTAKQHQQQQMERKQAATLNAVELERQIMERTEFLESENRDLLSQLEQSHNEFRNLESKMEQLTQLVNQQRSEGPPSEPTPPQQDHPETDLSSDRNDSATSSIELRRYLVKIEELEAEVTTRGYRIDALQAQLIKSAQEASREAATLKTKILELELASSLQAALVRAPSPAVATTTATTAAATTTTVTNTKEDEASRNDAETKSSASNSVGVTPGSASNLSSPRPSLPPISEEKRSGSGHRRNSYLRPIGNMEDFMRKASQMLPGEMPQLLVLRGGEKDGVKAHHRHRSRDDDRDRDRDRDRDEDRKRDGRHEAHRSSKHRGDPHRSSKHHSSDSPLNPEESVGKRHEDTEDHATPDRSSRRSRQHSSAHRKHRNRQDKNSDESSSGSSSSEGEDHEGRRRHHKDRMSRENHDGSPVSARDKQEERPSSAKLPPISATEAPTVSAS